MAGNLFEKYCLCRKRGPVPISSVIYNPKLTEALGGMDGYNCGKLKFWMGKPVLRWFFEVERGTNEWKFKTIFSNAEVSEGWNHSWNRHVQKTFGAFNNFFSKFCPTLKICTSPKYLLNYFKIFAYFLKCCSFLETLQVSAIRIQKFFLVFPWNCLKTASFDHKNLDP